MSLLLLLVKNILSSLYVLFLVITRFSKCSCFQLLFVRRTTPLSPFCSFFDRDGDLGGEDDTASSSSNNDVGDLWGEGGEETGTSSPPPPPLSPDVTQGTQRWAFLGKGI